MVSWDDFELHGWICGKCNGDNITAKPIDNFLSSANYLLRL